MEAGIGFTVVPRLKKLLKPSSCETDFLGKEALQKSLQRGVQRRLVCLTLDNTDTEHHRPLSGMETLWRDGTCVGYVRSTAFGHTVGSTIAYGYVSKAPPRLGDVGMEQSVMSEKITNEWLQAGAWAIGDRGERCKATLHLKSPYDPSNEKIAAKHEPR